MSAAAASGSSSRIAGLSPRDAARLAGFLYLIIMGTGWLSELYIRGGLEAPNAAATAANLLHSESAWRLAGAIDFVILFCDTSIALLLYFLLRPVDDALSLLAAFFRLVFVAVQAVGMVFELAPFAVLKGSLSAAFTTAEAQALSALLIRLHGTAYVVALLFFAVHCLLIGALIARASFLPRILGAFLVIAGLCYLVNSAVLFFPPLAVVRPYILLPGAFAEGALTLWLLFMGVNAARWAQQAQRAGARTAAAT